MSKTVCVIPWTMLAIRPDGAANFCCDVPLDVTIGGRPASIYSDSIDDIWNGDQLIAVRQAMARGEKPPMCGVCWKREETGGVSRRILMNRSWQDRIGIETLARTGAETGYRLADKPETFVLELGNLCNLKCRSCCGVFSSRIAADKVQTAWTGELGRVSKDRTPWYKEPDAVIDALVERAERGRLVLSLIGGEPFLIEHTWRVLDALVARGAAAATEVGLLTNGQQRSAEVERLAPHFKTFNVSFSIDGYGALYEYLRHPARWRKLLDTLGWIRGVPNVHVGVVPTLQNVNALDMVTLVRFLDERDMKIIYNVLNWPARLSAMNLPPNVRRIAAQRLRAFLDSECTPANVAAVRGYCEVLEDERERFDPVLFEEFMTFTNDLDAARGESLREVAPELVALIAGAGIEWSHARRHASAENADARLVPDDVLERVDRTVSSRDVIFPGFESARTGAYFTSAAEQLDEIDRRLRHHGHPGLRGSGAVADYAAHYGRLTRVLRAALPQAAVYACDIDPDAIDFCAGQLGALPVSTGWRPEDDGLPTGLDAVFCISLLTHTALEHWRSTLHAWARMLRPGGVAAFTYLDESRVGAWLAGEMPQYGTYPAEGYEAAARAVGENGFGFASLGACYGKQDSYGVSFASRTVVEREIAAAGLELIALPSESSPVFGQELALVRRPLAPAPPDTAPVDTVTVRRDVSVVALYDPRAYAPADAREGDPSASMWARLAAADPPRPLPTELGFADPRVPDVREEQAALARTHGIDAFCYLYPWDAGGPRWDAPLRDLLATGRPDFPFCLMLTLEDGQTIDSEGVNHLVETLAPALRDRRYVCVGERRLFVVRDVRAFAKPPIVAHAIRAAVAARGLGELHLCALRPPHGESPETFGFDSFLLGPPAANSAGDSAAAIGRALAAPWPDYRAFRTVVCRRDDPDPDATGLYEHWLRSAIETTRRHEDGAFVFVDAWNDWLGARYLEPDDRDGAAPLLATRRAARGPASAVALVRRLHDALGEIGEPASGALAELKTVLGATQRARDRLLATVEAALGPQRTNAHAPLRSMAVPTRHLPPSGGHFNLDAVHAGGSLFPATPDAVPLRGEEARFTGWAHPPECTPAATQLYVALESVDGGEDRIFRSEHGNMRADVSAAYPQYSARCGFEATAELADVPAGTYRVAIVQRTPNATYRDATGVLVVRE